MITINVKYWIVILVLFVNQLAFGLKFLNFEAAALNCLVVIAILLNAINEKQRGTRS